MIYIVYLLLIVLWLETLLASVKQQPTTIWRNRPGYGGTVNLSRFDGLARRKNKNNLLTADLHHGE
jgi:hypothetical protein